MVKDIEEIVLEPEKEIRHTIQEKKNHREFKFNVVMFLFNILLLIISIDNKIYWAVGIGVFTLTLILYNMFLCGYSHGWELKRISMKEEKE